MSGGVSGVSGAIVFKFSKEAIKLLLEGDCLTAGAGTVSVEVDDVSVEVDDVSLMMVSLGDAAAALAAASFSAATCCLCLHTCKWFLKSTFLRTVLVQYTQW